MKLYIRSGILLDPELQSVMDEYNARLDRYNAREEEFHKQNYAWREKYDAWQEELKTNPDAPRPDPHDDGDIVVAPWCDPEYSMGEAKHKLTIKTLDYIAGTNMWVKVDNHWWVKVLSRTKNPRKYIYYVCQSWNECSLGSSSFEVSKIRDDDVEVEVPIEILHENEFCKFVADKFSRVISDPIQIEDWIYAELDKYNGGKLPS